MTAQKISLELSREEAFVLFEWLHSFNDNEVRSFEDQAEQRVLWDLESRLETALDELIDKNYQKFLLKARANVRDESTGGGDSV